MKKIVTHIILIVVLISCNSKKSEDVNHFLGHWQLFDEDSTYAEFFFTDSIVTIFNSYFVDVYQRSYSISNDTIVFKKLSKDKTKWKYLIRNVTDNSFQMRYIDLQYSIRDENQKEVWYDVKRIPEEEIEEDISAFINEKNQPYNDSLTGEIKFPPGYRKLLDQVNQRHHKYWEEVKNAKESN